MKFTVAEAATRQTEIARKFCRIANMAEHGKLPPEILAACNQPISALDAYTQSQQQEEQDRIAESNAHLARLAQTEKAVRKVKELETKRAELRALGVVIKNDEVKENGAISK